MSGTRSARLHSGNGTRCACLLPSRRKCGRELDGHAAGVHPRHAFWRFYGGGLYVPGKLEFDDVDSCGDWGAFEALMFTRVS